jgi:hypothetical protein
MQLSKKRIKIGGTGKEMVEAELEGYGGMVENLGAKLTHNRGWEKQSIMKRVKHKRTRESNGCKLCNTTQSLKQKRRRICRRRQVFFSFSTTILEELVLWAS